METVIDCDIHPQIGDPEELLAYVTPAQREWFRAQGASLGLPGYSWAHPSSWFRQDIEQNGRPPGSDVDVVLPIDVEVPPGADVEVAPGVDEVDTPGADVEVPSLSVVVVVTPDVDEP